MKSEQKTYNKLLKTLRFAALDAAQPRPLAGRWYDPFCQ